MPFQTPSNQQTLDERVERHPEPTFQGGYRIIHRQMDRIFRFGKGHDRHPPADEEGRSAGPSGHGKAYEGYPSACDEASSPPGTAHKNERDVSPEPNSKKDSIDFQSVMAE